MRVLLADDHTLFRDGLRSLLERLGDVTVAGEAGDGREALKLIETNLKLAPDLAAQLYATATDAKTGFARDARLDIEGLKNVLRLRADHQGQWGGTPPSPDKYIDLSYYEKAMAGM